MFLLEGDAAILTLAGSTQVGLTHIRTHQYGRYARLSLLSIPLGMVPASSGGWGVGKLPTDNGVSIVKGEGCSMIKRSSEENVTEKDGTKIHTVCVIVTNNEGSAEKSHKRIMVKEGDAKPGVITEEHSVEMHAQAEGCCALSPDGKLHRNLTLKINENGTLSEGKLKIDIDAPPPAKE